MRGVFPTVKRSIHIANGRENTDVLKDRKRVYNLSHKFRRSWSQMHRLPFRSLHAVFSGCLRRRLHQTVRNWEERDKVHADSVMYRYKLLVVYD
jgi:hypothetical protein